MTKPDRARWHPVRKVHVGQCRANNFGPSMVFLRPGVNSLAWCRNDWECMPHRRVQLRAQFTQLCS